MPTSMTTEQANAVYDVLVEHAGAREDARTHFVATETGDVVREYRFQGALGFGGKFRRNGWDDQWRIDCYEEDLTPERQQMLDAANAALAELKRVAA